MAAPNLVAGPHVVLAEDAAQALVDAVGCPPEAVLTAAAAAAPATAPRRLGRAHQRGAKRQEEHEQQQLEPSHGCRERTNGTASKATERPVWRLCLLTAAVDRRAGRRR